MSGFEPTLFEQLARPFPGDAISWRVGATNAGRDGEQLKGIALAYIDARDVMERLDAVCGPENWQDRYSHASTKTVCEIGLRIDGEWLWKSDGAGDTDYEKDKGALSDAFKRAAVRWGIGRYLYAIPTLWVEIERRGKTYAIKKDEYKALNTLHAKCATEQEWGDNDDRNTLRILLQALRTFSDTVDVGHFIDANEGLVANLKVATKEKLMEEVNRIRDQQNAHKEAAE